MRQLAITLPALVLALACQNGSGDPEALTGDSETRPGDPEALTGDPETRPSDTPPRHAPSEAEHAEIVGTVQSLFDALAERDGLALRDLLHPDVVMHSVERAADGTRSQSTSRLDGLVDRVEGSEEVLTERMFDPEVRISGDLAMVWTPYDFYVGDEVSHCGADAVTLARSDTGWQIIGLSWTRLQPPECELHPDGPPA